MKKEQVWSDEAGVQVRFERAQDGGTVKIIRILKAENGHEYEDTPITIRGWRWDRIVEALK